MSKHELSKIEQEQLGKPKPGSIFNYVTEEEWQILRQTLVGNSFASNKFLKDPSMVAYTPGETYKLLHHPEVIAWQEAVETYQVPKENSTIILVPCAKTKPWDEKNSRRSVSYRAYHEIIKLSQQGKIPSVYFATISEPLGIVPQEMWGNFLQYDNPGLFNEDYLRTGFVQDDWNAVLGQRRVLPFDRDLYEESVTLLGAVIASFIVSNSDRRILSFVDALPGQKSTHQDMLDWALAQINESGLDINLQRFTKKRVARESPLDFILSKI